MESLQELYITPRKIVDRLNLLSEGLDLYKMQELYMTPRKVVDRLNLLSEGLGLYHMQELYMTPSKVVDRLNLLSEGISIANNGGFNADISGYTARSNSLISWDSSGAMLINVTGPGGGFLSNPIPHTDNYNSYKLEIRMKGLSYFGGFKVRLAEHEFILTESLTSEYVTYTKTIYTQYLNQAFEMFRSGTDTGTLLIDSISIAKVLA